MTLTKIKESIDPGREWIYGFHFCWICRIFLRVSSRHQHSRKESKNIILHTDIDDLCLVFLNGSLFIESGRIGTLKKFDEILIGFFMLVSLSIEILNTSRRFFNDSLHLTDIGKHKFSLQKLLLIIRRLKFLSPLSEAIESCKEVFIHVSIDFLIDFLIDHFSPFI